MKLYSYMLLLLLSFSSNSAELNNCTTKLRAHISPNLSIDLDLSYNFLDKDIVLMDAFGTLMENKNNFVINRRLQYHFNKIGKNTYELELKKINKNANDSYSGGFIGSYLLLGDNPVVWNISEVGKNLLFSNGYAPVFLCISSYH